jgi:DNA-binding transcriptional ArsR family regulator
MRPLFHPAIEDVRPEAILHALADPSRAAIFAKIMRAGCVEACSALAAVGDRVIPKSSLSNHFKVLREAGLIRSERHGVEVRNHSRWAEVEARFPGLLVGIINAYASDGGARCAETAGSREERRP